MLTSAIAMVLAVLLSGACLVFASACAFRDEAYGPFIFFAVIGITLLGSIAIRLIDYKVKEEIQRQVQQQTEQVESNKREVIEND